MTSKTTVRMPAQVVVLLRGALYTELQRACEDAPASTPEYKTRRGTGDAERAVKLVFGPQSLALGVQHQVEYGAVGERALLQPLWGTVFVHGELRLLVPRRRGQRRAPTFSVVPGTVESLCPPVSR